jgi:hypothetical protein
MTKPFEEFVEEAAKIRGDPTVSREYIEKALVLISENKVEVQRYPNGVPSLLDVYKVAAQLESEAAIKN